MSDQIHISTDELDNKIALLTMLCEDLKTTEPQRQALRPRGQGSGQVTAQLEALLTQYEQINNAVILLMENSCQFFTNIRNSMTNADESAASAIQK